MNRIPSSNGVASERVSLSRANWIGLACLAFGIATPVVSMYTRQAVTESKVDSLQAQVNELRVELRPFLSRLPPKES